MREPTTTSYFIFILRFNYKILLEINVFIITETLTKQYQDIQNHNPRGMKIIHLLNKSNMINLSDAMTTGSCPPRQV